MGRTPQPIKHGTYSGARAHRKRAIPLCDMCKTAERDYQKNRNRKLAAGDHVVTPRQAIRCGTRQGYERHHRNGERACRACLDAHAAYTRGYRDTHPDYAAKRYAPTPEARKRALARQSVEAKTPGTPRNYRQRARVLRRDAARRGGDISVGVTTLGLKHKLAVWGNKCWICGIRLTPDILTYDHVKPLSKGGKDVLANIRPCCRSCNCSKGNKWPFSKEQEGNCG